METLNLEQIRDLLKKRSSKRKDDESLWNIFLGNTSYSSLNYVWVMMNVILILGIGISFFTKSDILILCIVLLVLGNVIFFMKIKEWNAIRLEKSLVEKFNTSPEYFDKVIENLSQIKAYYYRKKDILEKKNSSNGLLQLAERDYYEKELIPFWETILSSIISDTEWCNKQRIDSIRRRDRIPSERKTIIQSIMKPHNDLV